MLRKVHYDWIETKPKLNALLSGDPATEAGLTEVFDRMTDAMHDLQETMHAYAKRAVTG